MESKQKFYGHKQLQDSHVNFYNTPCVLTTTDKILDAIISFTCACC